MRNVIGTVFVIVGVVWLLFGCSLAGPAYLSADCGEGFTMTGNASGFSGLNVTCKGKGTISTQVPPPPMLEAPAK